MKDLNTRQRKFVRGVTREGKSASVAYADTYGGESTDDSTRANASRLLAKDNVAEEVVKTMEEYERELEGEGLRAFQRNVDLALDPKTPANVKNDINKDIQNKSGIRPTQQIEVKDIPYEGLNDDEAVIELAKLAIKKRSKDER